MNSSFIRSTLPLTPKEKPPPPTVGWLVCITKGPNLGRDWPLFVGHNTIGRGPDNIVQVLGDAGIAKNSHAIIVFDPVEKKYMLLPGKSDKLIYMQKKLLFQAQELQDREVIELGKSEFVLIQLKDKNINHY